MSKRFGAHIRSLRRARGQTQEILAEKSGLSADTIRRLEVGSFSPSLNTLRKLCAGLDLNMSTLFESYELGECNLARELLDALVELTDEQLQALCQFLLTLRVRESPADD